MGTPCKSLQSKLSRAESDVGSSFTVDASTAVDYREDASFTDDIGPMDSVSHAARNTPEVEALVQKEMDKMQLHSKMAQLENSFTSKHLEVLQQMRVLQDRNALLEKQVEISKDA